MTADIPDKTPLSKGDEPQIIAHFVNEEGEIVSRWSATNLPLPSRHETVSFGQLHAPSADDLTDDEAQYSFEDPVYTVVDIEYSYSRIVTDEGENPEDYFVLVTVYLEETTTKY